MVYKSGFTLVRKSRTPIKMPTHRDMFYKKHGLDKSKSYSISELATISGVPKRILEEVYKRGLGAYSTNLPSVRLKGTFEKNPDVTQFGKEARLSAPQWGFSRIFSFLNKGKTYYTADADLAKKL